MPSFRYIVNKSFCKCLAIKSYSVLSFSEFYLSYCCKYKDNKNYYDMPKVAIKSE